MKRKSRGQFGIQSVEVASRILTGFVTAARPVPLKEIARLAGMHPGKVHRYLVSFTRSGLIVQDPASGYYGIGPQAIALGLAGLRSVDVVRTVMEYLPRLRDETNETALFSLWSREGPIVVELEESDRPAFMNVKVGSILPLLRTATGRVFMTYLPADATRELLKREKAELARVPAGRKKRYDPDHIALEVRKNGYASISGDLVPGVTAYAAPIFNHRTRIVAVIGMLGREEDLNRGQQMKAARQLLDIAREISARLGSQEAAS
jgi:DNA-binding IclR family transcriptional regulator